MGHIVRRVAGSAAPEAERPSTLACSAEVFCFSMLNLNVAKWSQLARHLLCLGSTRQWQSCTVMCSGQKAGFLLTNVEVSHW